MVKHYLQWNLGNPGTLKYLNLRNFTIQILWNGAKTSILKPKKYKRQNIINIALTNQTSEHPRNRTVKILSNTALTTQTQKTSEKIKQSKCDIKKSLQLPQNFVSGDSRPNFI